jgi:hypothetical protein
MIEDMWTMVRGEDFEGVSWDTLKIAMLNMIGVHTLDREFHQPAVDNSTMEEPVISPERTAESDDHPAEV